MNKAAKYKDIHMYITHHGPDKYSDESLVASSVYEVTFQSVWPIRGEDKMPPPPPEEIAKCVANALAAFLPGSYEIDYWVAERSVPPSETVFGQVGPPIAKKLRDIDVLLHPVGQESAEVKKCRETAEGFANRINEAKTEAERKKIRKEFDEWASTDPTFVTICKGAERLLSKLR